MNTHRTQGLTFGSLEFGEEDQFNPQSLERDLQDIISNDLGNLGFQNYSSDNLDKTPGVSTEVAFPLNQNKNHFTLRATDNYFSNMQDKHFKFNDKESCYFNLENNADKNIHPLVKRNEEGILFLEQGDDCFKDDKEEVDSVFANKTTLYSHQLGSNIQNSQKLEDRMQPVNPSQEQENYHFDFVNDLDNSYLAPIDTKAIDTPRDMKNSSKVNNFSNEAEVTNSGKTFIVDNIEAIEKYAQDSRDAIKATSIQPEEVDLSQRRDVVNKTVLRIVRRFFMQKFRETYAQKFKTKEAKSKWYFEYVKRFTSELFGAEHPDITLLQYFMASIINPKHMTKDDVKETGLDKEVFFAYYNTLYKYSHTRLVNLFKVNPLGTLYDYFFNGPMEEIINSEPSVCKNYALYSTAFLDFKKVFMGAANAITLTLN